MLRILLKIASIQKLLTEKPELREKLQQYINAKVLFQNALSKKEENL